VSKKPIKLSRISIAWAEYIQQFTYICIVHRCLIITPEMNKYRVYQM